MRDPPTIGGFISLWKCKPRHLAILHAERDFAHTLVRAMTPWIDRIASVRYAIFKNATDPSRKDQAEWMKQYENMIVEHAGPKYRFLPDSITQEDPHAERNPRGAARDQPRQPPARTLRVT